MGNSDYGRGGRGPDSHQMCWARRGRYPARRHRLASSPSPRARAPRSLATEVPAARCDGRSVRARQAPRPASAPPSGRPAAAAAAPRRQRPTGPNPVGFARVRAGDIEIELQGSDKEGSPRIDAPSLREPREPTGWSGRGSWERQGGRMGSWTAGGKMRAARSPAPSAYPVSRIAAPESPVAGRREGDTSGGSPALHT
jgi:hypothetical protein